MERFSGTSGMTSLEYIYFGSKVVNIGGVLCDTFEGCTNLKEVDLTNASSLKYINEGSFKNSGLEKITIPDGITLDKEVFYGCSNLKEVNFLGTCNDELPDSLFYGCSSLKELVLPEGITFNEDGYDKSFNDSPFGECTSLETLYLPSTVDLNKESDYVLFGTQSSLKHLYVNSTIVNLTNLHTYYSTLKWDENVVFNQTLTIHIGSNVKTMTGYFHLILIVINLNMILNVMLM